MSPGSDTFEEWPSPRKAGVRAVWDEGKRKTMSCLGSLGNVKTRNWSNIS